ncbi:beta-lactamase family protein [Catenulispora sp. NF23]|uniref:serine hydrolase domain-containing protein n=1 Tax=Catenulispora pinistramenti TaxID=2705254 RepID=UPI001BA91511|nr:serine hydrolase domain-containing protein [Catenulispora pinistramenti]MBS2534626.1 beta-lactamase family protein [Catenulispora pinistramenti]
MKTAGGGVIIGVSRDGRRTIEKLGPLQADESSVFRIASLTKPLTAVATVRALAERGIALTTPAIELLPDLAADWRADRTITVEQLLGQVAGLRESVDGATVAALGQGPEVLQEAARLVVRAGNERVPGEAWSYYNGNYFLAGCILATLAAAGTNTDTDADAAPGTGTGAATGSRASTSYEQALDATLLSPWHLTRTGFDTPPAPVTGWDEQTPLPVETYPRGRRPSGGLWSCVADYLSFAEQLMADPALLAEIRRARTRPEDPMRYGLAWALGPSGQMYLNGRLDGYRTAVLLAPEHGYASVAFGNQTGLLPRIAKRLSESQQELTGDDLAVEIDAFAA